MKYIYALAILAVIGTGALLVLSQKEAAAPTQLEQGALSYTKDAQGNRVHAESTDVYDIAAIYPDSSPAGASAALSMETFVAGVIAQFKADGRLNDLTEEDKRVQGLDGTRKYALAIEHKTYTSARTVSYVYLIYQNTLGAHPNVFYGTFVFDSQTGAELALGDLFVSGSRYLERLSAETFAQVKAELEMRSGAEVSGDALDTVRIGTSPTPETLQFFFIDGGNLVIIIPPYQAAAYAAGDFKVTISLSSLSDILKPEYK